MREVKQGRFDLSFAMKIPYFQKSIENLCYEEYMLLQLAWDDYIKRVRKEMKR